MRRKKNRGWFKKGPDQRRHELTKEERQRGYQTAILRDWHIGTWVWRKVRSYYRKLRREQHAAEAAQARSRRAAHQRKDQGAAAGGTSGRDSYDESAIPY